MDISTVIQKIKDLIKQKIFHWISERGKIDDFIIEKSAKAEVQKITDELIKTFRKKLEDILKTSLAPTFEYKHISETGLRIWGKAENVAISKSTFVEIFNAIKSISNDDLITQTVLENAGSKTALAFFDTFREILYLENIQYVPTEIINFMDVLGEFDTKSAWWEAITYNSSKNGFDISITKPFWRYPWFDKTNHLYTSFISGYLLTLHNCCYDYINIVSRNTERNFKESFGIKIEILPDLDDTKSSLKLIRTKKYIDEFYEIDIMIHLLIDWLSSEDNLKANRSEVFELFDSLRDKINMTFKCEIDCSSGLLKELYENKSKDSPLYQKKILDYILNNIRNQYNHLRIGELIKE